MAEEVNDKVAALETRLNKATEAYKALKTDYEKLYAENEALKSNQTEGCDVKVYEKRIKELEDEITINGNASGEIKALTERIDKAKLIFKEQKERIAELESEIEKNTLTLKNNTETIEGLVNKLNSIREILK